MLYGEFEKKGRKIQEIFFQILNENLFFHLFKIVSHESCMHIAQHSMDWGKDFFFNLGMYNNKNENKFKFLFTFHLLSHLFFLYQSI